MLTLTQDMLFAGRYRIVRSIASGGMGAVYEVEHVETSRHHALKVLLPSLVDRQEIRDRFKQEARITATIESEAIVQVFDAGVDTDTGMPFLVMELLRGEDLAKVVARDGPLPPAKVVGYLMQAATALDKTHAAKVVHRDLKPENLFLSTREDGSEQVKILDFGVAKLLVEGAAGSNATSGFGTPLYMAPEQFKCTGVCPATDIYSLGMIAFTLLVGTPYWEPEVAQRGTVFAFATLAVNGTREPASVRARERGVELPPAFDAWFARMTSVDPKTRYRQPSETIAELASIFSVLLPNRSNAAASTGEPVSSSLGTSGCSAELAATQLGTPPIPFTPSSKRRAVIAAIVVCAIGAVAGFALLGRHEPATGSSPLPSAPSSAELASAQPSSVASVESAAPAIASAESAPSASAAASVASATPVASTVPVSTGARPAKGKAPVASATVTASPQTSPDSGRSRYSRE